MKTSTLDSGTFPAGSYTFPDSVVTTPPVHAGCVQFPILHVDCWHWSPVHGPWPMPPWPPNPIRPAPPPPLGGAAPGEKLQPQNTNAARIATRKLVMSFLGLPYQRCARWSRHSGQKKMIGRDGNATRGAPTPTKEDWSDSDPLIKRTSMHFCWLRFATCVCVVSLAGCMGQSGPSTGGGGTGPDGVGGTNIAGTTGGTSAAGTGGSTSTAGTGGTGTGGVIATAGRGGAGAASGTAGTSGSAGTGGTGGSGP